VGKRSREVTVATRVERGAWPAANHAPAPGICLAFWTKGAGASHVANLDVNEASRRSDRRETNSEREAEPGCVIRIPLAFTRFNTHLPH